MLYISPRHVSTVRRAGNSPARVTSYDPLKGRSTLQFRLEATNVFNMVNLSNPGTNLGAAATFGKIRTARDLRRIQLGMRFSFQRSVDSWIVEFTAF